MWRSASLSACSARERSATSPCSARLARSSSALACCRLRVQRLQFPGLLRLQGGIGFARAARWRPPGGGSVRPARDACNTVRPAPRPCCAGSPAPRAPTRSPRRRACSRLSRSSSDMCTPVTKMIGVRSKRGCSWIRRAASKPSISGMLTSSSTTANSLRISLSSASRPEDAAHQVLVQLTQHRSDR